MHTHTVHHTQSRQQLLQLAESYWHQLTLFPRSSATLSPAPDGHITRSLFGARRRSNKGRTVGMCSSSSSRSTNALVKHVQAQVSQDTFLFSRLFKRTASKSARSSSRKTKSTLHLHKKSEEAKVQLYTVTSTRYNQCSCRIALLSQNLNRVIAVPDGFEPQRMH